MRKRQKTLLSDNLVGSLEPMLFTSNKASGIDGMETLDTPYVHVNDLNGMIVDYLNRHEL